MPVSIQRKRKLLFACLGVVSLICLAAILFFPALWLRTVFLGILFLLPFVSFFLLRNMQKEETASLEEFIQKTLHRIHRGDSVPAAALHWREEGERILHEMKGLEDTFQKEAEEHTQFVLSWIGKFQKSISDLEQIRVLLEERKDPLSLDVEREKMAMDGMLEQIKGYFTSIISRQKYSIQEVELPKLVSDAVIRNAPLFSEKSIGFRRNTIKLPVHTDPQLFGIALDEVLSNAIKHSAYGAYIGIMCRDGEQAATLTIEDSGDGIPQEDRSRIFEKGFRGRNEHTGSAGMGLYLANTYLSLLGHTIQVESRQGHGTRVVITLKK